MKPRATSLPCPPLTIGVEVPSTGEADWLRIPAIAGVLALEDARGRTLLLAATGDLRRAARSRLAPPDETVKRPRVEFRGLTRVIRACTVGSRFEADWAFLQHARLRAPLTCRAAAERWRAWFVHLDPEGAHPRLTKTCTPDLASPGPYLGPIADKHAAAKAMDALQAVFDLCRYHHILVQAPNATACAYKEMGRCPAPCDGSVSMDHYRGQVQAAVAFVRLGAGQWKQAQTELIEAARQTHDTATLARLQRQLDDAAPLLKPAMANLGLLEQFRFLIVLPAEMSGWVRLLLADGGWIEPLADVPGLAPKSEIAGFVRLTHQRTRRPMSIDAGEAWMDNLHLVGWHLLRPRPRSIAETFIRLDRLDAPSLTRAIRKAASTLQIAPVDEQDFEPTIEQ